MVRICVWGDSITYRYSDSEGGWCDRLKKYFINHYKISIYNLGIPSNSTKELLFRFETEIKVREPDVVVFQIGLNDSQFTHTNPRVSLTEYKSNLHELVGIANKFAHKILFIGITPVDEARTTPTSWDSTKYYYSEQVKKYDETLQAFCKEKDLPYVAVKSVIALEDLDDGVHPNSHGHEKMFAVIKEAVLKIV